MKKKNGLRARAKLARDVYESMYDITDSFEKFGHVLVYLLGEILEGGAIEIFEPPDEPEQEFLDVMKRAFPETHEVWKWVLIVPETETTETRQ